IAMRIEALGIDATVTTSKPGAARLYSLRLPSNGALEARACVVCGTRFTPRTPQVKTCGRSCGGQSSRISAPVSAPTCVDCGGPATGTAEGRCRDCFHDHGSVVALLR